MPWGVLGAWWKDGSPPPGGLQELDGSDLRKVEETLSSAFFYMTFLIHPCPSPVSRLLAFLPPSASTP